MPYDFCPDHSAHEHALERHEQRLNSHSEQLDAVKEERHEIEVMMQRLIDLSEYAQKRIDQHAVDLERHEKRIQELEEQPVKDIRRIKEAALGAVGGAIGTGVIGLIAIALTTIN